MKKLFVAGLGAILVFGISSIVYGWGQYATNFKNAYPSSPLSNLNSNVTNPATAGSICRVCHDGSGLMNSFGNAYKNSTFNFKPIEGLDSDGDGATNIVEINAGTYPGDLTSTPGDVGKPVVTVFNVPASSTSLKITVSTLAATDNVGVTGYMITESAAPPSADDSAWTMSVPANYTFAAGAANGTKTLYAYAKDAAGNVSDGMSATMTLNVPNADTTKPSVSLTSPANGATGVSVNTSVIAVFSEAMNSSTINSSTLSVSGVSGSVSYNSAARTATFTPSSALASGTAYTATVTTGVKDVAGNAMAANYSWSFATAGGAGQRAIRQSRQSSRSAPGTARWE